MCHRRSDWSRTSSRATESEDEPTDEREWWGVRAKERLAALLSVEDESVEKAPDTPTVATRSNRDEMVGDEEPRKTEDDQTPDTRDEEAPDTEDEREAFLVGVRR